VHIFLQRLDTFAFFAKQGVAVKVISGDDPVTVSYIARLAGIPGADAYIDAGTLSTIRESGVNSSISFASLYNFWHEPSSSTRSPSLE